jgi:hypothetical protein
MSPSERNTKFKDPQDPKIVEVMDARSCTLQVIDLLKISKKKVDEESAGEYGPPTSSIGSQNVFPL